MRRIAPLCALLLAACEDPGDLEPDAGLETPSVGLDAEAPDQAASTVRVADQPNPRALAQIVAAAPEGHPSPTGPDGGTLVGTDTGVDGGAPVLRAPADAHEPGRSGPVRVEPLVSSPALERAARAQVYWALAQKCTTTDGKLPPPESIFLSFTIGSDGSVDPTSISVTSEDPSLATVVDCVLREFAATPFTVPAARGGARSTVLVAWPSVD
jgi:hypothetical protein